MQIKQIQNLISSALPQDIEVDIHADLGLAEFWLYIGFSMFWSTDKP